MITKKDYTTKDVVTLRNGRFQVYLNYYWWCEGGDGTKALFYKGYAPQCNVDKSILTHMKEPYAGCEIVQLPMAFIPIEDRYEYKEDYYY